MDFKTCTRFPCLLSQQLPRGQNAWKITGLVLGFLFSIFIAAYAGKCQSREAGISANVADNGMKTTLPQNQIHHPVNAPPLKPYPRLLPLQLSAPTLAQVGEPLDGVSITLRNPGNSAPAARLRLIIHHKVRGQPGTNPALTPDTVKVEVLENGSWIPVVLGMTEGGVMGAIGTEGVAAHRERYQRGGFAIPAGLHKTWQLRVTFNSPGIYTFVAAVSPDNGSRHLAQPAHADIEVQ